MIHIRFLLIACALMLSFPLSAHAIPQAIVGDSAATPPASPPSNPPRLLSIYVGDSGSLQAKRGTANEDFPGMFFGGSAAPATNYWHLRIKGAPANNVVFGSRDTAITGVSNVLSPTGAWTPASPARVDTLMNVVHNTAGVNEKLFEVKQSVLYVAGETRYRVVWEIRNTDPQSRTIPFIFGTSADLFIGSDAGCGVFVEGANRFLGVTNKFAPFTTGGLEEVTSSLLPGETGPTPIARWASYEEGEPFPLVRRLSSGDAFRNTINPLFMDAGVGVSFDDRATTGLASGQVARYEVIWHHTRPTVPPACPLAAAAEVRAASDDTPAPSEPGTDGGGAGAGAGAEPTSAGSGVPLRDTTAPVLSALRLSPSAARSSSTTVAAAKVRASAPKLSFRLSERANVVVRIVRRRGGRRVTVNKVTLPNLAVGSNAVRIGAKRLKPGSYVVFAQAVDAAGNRGARRSAAFRITR